MVKRVAETRAAKGNLARGGRWSMPTVWWCWTRVPHTRTRNGPCVALGSKGACGRGIQGDPRSGQGRLPRCQRPVRRSQGPRGGNDRPSCT